MQALLQQPARLAGAFGLALWAFASPVQAKGGVANLTGAIATVTAAPACAKANVYADLSQVWFKPGPSIGGGSNLPNGSYFVRVTDPSGATTLSATQTVMVTGGQIGGANCVPLTSIVGSISATPNGGGEYKVWASTQSDFPESATKTDNFKIDGPVASPTGSISIYKFYDANVNGYGDVSESLIAGWKVQVDALAPLLTDGVNPTTTVYSGLDLTGHIATEAEPLGNSVLNPYAWVATNAYDLSQDFAFNGPSGAAGVLNAIRVDLSATPADRVVLFGNVCIGPAAGGRTLGYWSNKNGLADMLTLGRTGNNPTTALAALGGLHLVDANGIAVGNFGGSYNNFRNWLLNGNAVNMAYMLSVQLASLQLSVLTGKLGLNDMVYAPGSDLSQYANPAGFVSIGTIIQTADNQLSGTPVTRAGISQRVQQEMLKTAIDNINNNRAAVAQPDGSRCPALSFAN